MLINNEIYNQFYNLNRDIYGSVLQYFNEVIRKDDINEELAFVDVWYHPIEIKILYENVESGKKYKCRLTVDEFITYANNR